MTIGVEERAAFRETASSFAQRSIRPLLDHESADGDLSRVPAVLEQAFQTGLLACPSPQAPGHESGIWGKHCLEHGPRVSLMLLEELAVACGGVAMNLHALGLGSLLLTMAKNLPDRLPGRVAPALAEGGFAPGTGTIQEPSLDAPARINTTAESRGGGYVLRGRKDFVYQGFGAEAFVVFAREEKQWAAFLVPAKASGLKVEDVGYRMGLRACPLVHLEFKDVEAGARLELGRPLPEAVMQYLGWWWLGMVAIGAGIARGALKSARLYARERYQGCAEIINHPGMGMLFSDSEANIMVCQGLLDRAGSANGSPRDLFRDAARAKLAGLYAAAQAVTDSLQVFGGYGYMEDYRMEKRYRDINTLKSAGAAPRELRQIIAELGKEE